MLGCKGLKHRLKMTMYERSSLSITARVISAISHSKYISFFHWSKSLTFATTTQGEVKIKGNYCDSRLTGVKLQPIGSLRPEEILDHGGQRRLSHALRMQWMDRLWLLCVVPGGHAETVYTGQSLCHAGYRLGFIILGHSHHERACKPVAMRTTHKLQMTT